MVYLLLVINLFTYKLNLSLNINKTINTFLDTTNIDITKLR